MVYLSLLVNGGCLLFYTLTSVTIGNMQSVTSNAVYTDDYVVHARIIADGRIQAWNTSTFNVTSVNAWQADLVYRID